MLYQLVRPMRRAGSRVPQFVKRVPRDIRDRLVGKSVAVPLGDKTHWITFRPNADSIRFSLQTIDPATAKRRQAEILAVLEMFFQAIRDDKPISLTRRQAAALAGDIYRAWSGDRDEGRTKRLSVEHTPEGWVLADDAIDPETEALAAEAFHERLVVLEASSEAAHQSELDRTIDPLIDNVLVRHGIASVDAHSRVLLLHAFLGALKDAFTIRPKRMRMDFTPDAAANRYPELELTSAPKADPKSASLKGLVEDWWNEAQATGRKVSTYESYRNTMAALVAFLKHDDAWRVTPEDIIRFKDFRLSSINPKTGKPISAKTVKDSDLSGLKSVFGWAKDNRKIPTNPAEGVTIKLGKKAKLRERGFRDEEAKALLRAALGRDGGREQPWTAAAKRWVPWVLAYTGARVGEIAQLRKEDIRQEGERWIIRITPEAGSVKTNEAREVVVHPHLIEQGFCRFASAAKAGYLFLKPAKDGDIRGPLRGLKNRLAEEARAIVTDPNVQPNHGWRHRFKTIGMDVAIDHRILDAIQGHAPKTEGETYGDVSLKAIAAAIEKLPRYEV